MKLVTSVDLTNDTGYVLARHATLRPKVLIAAVFVVLLTLLVRGGSLHLAASYEQQAISALPSVHSQSASKPPIQPSTPVVGIISTPQSKTNDGQILPSLASCIPDTQYALPDAINLANDPLGLTKVVDAPSQYQIYGYQASDLRDQISHCAPNLDGGTSAEFTSETGYHLSWQYTYAAIGNGKCTIDNIKVGLHVNQVMPLWMPTQYAAVGLAAKWQTFMTNLTTHENGHTALDEQYAVTLLGDMQSMPATDCSTLVQAVNSITGNDINQLNAANDAYDAATNHGATQGAILPS